MDIVRFGVIGVGGMGSHHVSYLNSVAGAKLAAICDNDPKRLEKFAKLEVPKFERYQDLLDANLVDAVIIATPHYDHPPITRAAFAKNLHVLSEKPIAVTVKEARKTNELYEQKYKHLKFGVMFQTRTSAMYMKMRELIQAGEVGEIGRITWTATRWLRTWTYYASGGWRATWSGEGGGVLINQNPHNLDLLQWVPNMMPRRVTAVASIAKTHPIEVEDEVGAIMEYDNGAIGHFITSTGEAPGTDRLEIAGDRGRLVAEDGKLRFLRTRQSVRDIREKSPHSFPHVESWDMEIPCPAKFAESHKTVTEAFVRAVLKDEPMIAHGTEGIRGLEIGNAMLMAGLTRKPVELPLDGDAYEQFLKDLAKQYGGRKTLGARTDGVGDVAASFAKH